MLPQFRNAPPQQSIFDAPSPGQVFITQLVCAGADARGSGDRAGKILAQFTWNSTDMKKTLKEIEIPEFKPEKEVDEK